MRQKIRSQLLRGLCPNRMNKINKEWHEKNRMPKNPTLDQRVTWHVDHTRNCQCRKLEGKMLEEINKRGIKV